MTFFFVFCPFLRYDPVLRLKSKRQKTSSSGPYKGTKLFSYPKRLFDKLRQMLAETKDNNLWQNGNNLFAAFQLKSFSFLNCPIKICRKILIIYE
jgi:hypothetical protein